MKMKTTVHKMKEVTLNLFSKVIQDDHTTTITTTWDQTLALKAYLQMLE